MKVCHICGKPAFFKRHRVSVCFPDGTVELIHLKCGVKAHLLDKGFKVPKEKKLENWFEINKTNVKRGEIEYGK